jgi:hypothetical protein
MYFNCIIADIIVEKKILLSTDFVYVKFAEHVLRDLNYPHVRNFLSYRIFHTECVGMFMMYFHTDISNTAL